MMKIALTILPVWTKETPPHGLSYIIACLKKAGYKISVYDLNIQLWADLNKDNDLWQDYNGYKLELPDYFNKNVFPKIKNLLNNRINELSKYNFDIIGFSVFSTNIHITTYAATLLKKAHPKVKIIFGGPEAKSSSVLDLLKEGIVDIIIPGAGENTIVQLISALENNNSIINIPGIIAKDDEENIFDNPTLEKLSLDELPLPDYSDFDMSLYKQLPFSINRGCVGNCAFCTDRSKFISRSPQYVLKEITSSINSFGITDFINCDSAINGNHRTLEEFAEMIIKENIKIKWGGSARIDNRLTPPLLDKLIKAGCHYLIFGVESGSDKVLKLMNKGITVDSIKSVIRNVCNSGIYVIINILIGFPGEGEEEFNDTLQFLLENKTYINKVNANSPMVVLENSEVYKNPEKYGIAMDNNGKVLFDGDNGWKTVDNKNNSAIRKNRHFQLLYMMKKNKILQDRSDSVG
jgi:anaerobic magnesium-protoporphyrin IX monomethyl ester cyclase